MADDRRLRENRRGECAARGADLLLRLLLLRGERCADDGLPDDRLRRGGRWPRPCRVARVRVADDAGRGLRLRRGLPWP
jgi:hypothetical protein